jgi:hypothetical protein
VTQFRPPPKQSDAEDLSSSSWDGAAEASADGHPGPTSEFDEARNQLAQKNDEVQRQIKQEMKREIEDQVRTELRAEFVGELKEELQSRIRKELSIQFKLKFQMEMRAHLRALSNASGNGAEGRAWIQAATKKQSDIMKQLRKEVLAREKQVSTLQEKCDKFKDEASLLTLTLREKDHLLQQLTEILRTYRQYAQEERVVKGKKVKPADITKVIMQPIERADPSRPFSRENQEVPAKSLAPVDDEFPIKPKLVERFALTKKDAMNAKKTKKARTTLPNADKNQIGFSRQAVQDFLKRSRR